MLGIVPQFNTTSNPDAAPLTRRHKFQLAFASVIDPGTIGVAALDAGYGQLTNSYPEYRQGVEGYAKYLGASYAATSEKERERLVTAYSMPWAAPSGQKAIRVSGFQTMATSSEIFQPAVSPICTTLRKTEGRRSRLSVR